MKDDFRGKLSPAATTCWNRVTRWRHLLPHFSLACAHDQTRLNLNQAEQEISLNDMLKFLKSMLSFKPMVACSTVAMGAFGRLIPPLHKAPSLPKLKYETLLISGAFVEFRMSSPPPAQT